MQRAGRIHCGGRAGEWLERQLAASLGDRCRLRSARSLEGSTSRITQADASDDTSELHTSTPACADINTDPACHPHRPATQPHRHQHLLALTFSERERLADEVYARQPHMLASVVVLQQYGVTLEQMEVMLNVLLVFYEAMRASGKTWPVISEDIQDICMQRVTARVGFIEG